MAVLLSALLLKSALTPLAVLLLPVVLLVSALTPVAVLKLPNVLFKSASSPLAVLPLPAVLNLSASLPVAERAHQNRWPCGEAVCVAIERIKTDGRVEAAGCEVEERIVTLSGVLICIASVRCWDNRLRCGRKPKAGEREYYGYLIQ